MPRLLFFKLLTENRKPKTGTRKLATDTGPKNQREMSAKSASKTLDDNQYI